MNAETNLMTPTSKNIIYCTYFDKGYLLKGLSMHASFIRRNPDARLWILAFDDYTRKILEKLKLKGVKVIKLKDFEDKALLKAKKTRTMIEYYWTSTPSLPLYIFRKNPEIEYVCYLDADLYFYSPVSPVYREMGNKSIYSVEHRFPKGEESKIGTSGRFNVAFQIFRKDVEGIKCLKRWRRQCLDWCYWRLEDGKLGDQLYLNEWPKLYKGLQISKNIGIDAAPWNIGQYKVSEKKGQIYINCSRLICYHFHQFQILGDNSFENTHGYNLKKTTLDVIYEPYKEEIGKQLLKLRKIDASFTIVGPRIESGQKVKNSLSRLIGPVYWRARSYLWPKTKKV
ncbi:glycosyltransferase [Patescibacteria group bacterium]|nr:glycosyltransferase [Patescibacteria group bacterium]